MIVPLLPPEVITAIQKKAQPSIWSQLFSAVVSKRPSPSVAQSPAIPAAPTAFPVLPLALAALAVIAAVTIMGRSRRG